MGKESFAQIYAREAADNTSNSQKLGDLQQGLSKLKRDFKAEVDHHIEHMRHFRKHGTFVQELPTKI